MKILSKWLCTQSNSGKKYYACRENIISFKHADNILKIPIGISVDSIKADAKAEVPGSGDRELSRSICSAASRAADSAVECSSKACFTNSSLDFVLTSHFGQQKNWNSSKESGGVKSLACKWFQKI